MDTAAPVFTGEEAQARRAELPTPPATPPLLAIGTVLEADSGPNAGVPMLCFMVLTSLPPQCGGPQVLGWDWSSVEHETLNGVRWTPDLALRVTYDAAAGTLTPLEVLDLAALSLPAPETPSGTLDPAAVEAVQADIVTLKRPDVMGGGGGDGIVVLEVVYDDGSIQAALDEIYGPGAVHVTSWLR